MQKIVTATDFSGRADRAMARAMQLARQHDAALDLLCVIDGDLPENFIRTLREEAERHLAEAVAEAARQGVRAAPAVVAGRPYAEILRAAREGAADLIVLGTHRDDRFSDLFLGTTVERVIRHGHAPVLVVRDPATAAYGDVLVAVDFSVCSRLALNFALRAAPDAAFRLLHAYETPFPAFLPSEDDAREWQEGRRRDFEQFLEAELAKLTDGADRRTQAILSRGDAVGAITKEVADRKPELLVLGTHGRSSFGRAVIGGVARIFLCAPPCDVLAVRAG
jgi:nucleotide-binding universal stress UspA family protein